MSPLVYHICACICSCIHTSLIAFAHKHTNKYDRHILFLNAHVGTCIARKRVLHYLFLLLIEHEQITVLELVGTLQGGVLDRTTSGSLSTLSTVGGELLRITGLNLGPATPRAYVSSVYYGNPSVGKLVLNNCSFVTPHTQVECLTVPGVGTNHKMQVTPRLCFHIPLVCACVFKSECM